MKALLITLALAIGVAHAGDSGWVWVTQGVDQNKAPDYPGTIWEMIADYNKGRQHED